MTPALYRPLFPRKGERKERLYYASSKHPKSSLSSSQVVLSSFCRQKSKKKRKTKEKERTTIPSPPPSKGVKIRIRAKFLGVPFFFGCSFCLFVFMWVHHPFLCFFVFFFFILLVAFFLCGKSVSRQSSTPLVLSILCLRATNWLPPPPFIYINVGIVFLIAPQKRRRRREDTTTTMSSAFAMHAKTSAFTTGAARVLSSSNASSNR